MLPANLQKDCLAALLRLYPAHSGVPLAQLVHALLTEGWEMQDVLAGIQQMRDKEELSMVECGLALDGEPLTLVYVTEVGERLHSTFCTDG